MQDIKNRSDMHQLKYTFYQRKQKAFQKLAKNPSLWLEWGYMAILPAETVLLSILGDKKEKEGWNVNEINHPWFLPQNIIKLLYFLGFNFTTLKSSVKDIITKS